MDGQMDVETVDRRASESLDGFWLDTTYLDWLVQPRFDSHPQAWIEHLGGIRVQSKKGPKLETLTWQVGKKVFRHVHM